MSLATSVKDYVEITHKLIEIEPLKNYTEFGAVFTYFIFSIGDFFKNTASLGFSLLKNVWSIPIIIPDIASAMISEVSVLDGYFHNAFTFLETNLNTGTNTSLVIFEKFMIGLINSIFLILPTSTSHLIVLRRFVMQGLEAGYLAGLGTLAGNFLWLASIILGWRFFVIPWLSLDIFRYLLGFILLVKYIWDSSKERRIVLEDLSKWKIFLLNFLLALTEQSCIYPFISNLSIGPEASILEGFPVENYSQFITIHGAYLVGILLGSFSLLQLTCWFWENPAFSIYLWLTTKSSNNTAFANFTSRSYYKILQLTFLYATMLCAIASVPYYGLDYTITNPIGLVPQDRMLTQKKSQSNPDKLIPETAFLNINSTDKNSRIRDGVHARRERWKQRLIKYQAFDASMYDQGVYDFLTIEDLNYGFDRFWLRRKMRNHQIRFRLFPGPWMRSLKKQLNNPSSNSDSTKLTKSTTGPRVEFFRILFEQFYHPNFHQVSSKKISTDVGKEIIGVVDTKKFVFTTPRPLWGIGTSTQRFNTSKLEIKPGLVYQNSALRKYVRNVNTRVNLQLLTTKNKTLINKYNSEFIYSKRWKNIFSKLQPYSIRSSPPSGDANILKTQSSYQNYRNLSKQLLLTNSSFKLNTIKDRQLTAKDRKILALTTKLGALNPTSQYLTILNQSTAALPSGNGSHPFGDVEKSSTPLQGEDLPTRFARSLHSIDPAKQDPPFNPLTRIFDPPSGGRQILFNFTTFDQNLGLTNLNIYLQKEQAFKRKLRYYGATPLRKLTVGNQAPYFKALMKRGFYYYKPSLRWKKTLYVASMRRGFRKKSRKQRIFIPLNVDKSDKTNSSPQGTVVSLTNTNNTTVIDNNQVNITKPTHSYTVLGKRASRYRHQIYKDVLQHWYYTPFNRLLMKFDIDSFINRQPKGHLLTKNEERLLHLRRFLLSEHYDTLRWYSYMQHYKTMKTNIGGTKSFANRAYNQQFQGTFKKIRHLFAITPKQGDFYTLKFDQPLYNENNLKDNVYLHEELFNDTLQDKTPNDPLDGRESVDRVYPLPGKEISRASFFHPLGGQAQRGSEILSTTASAALQSSSLPTSNPHPLRGTASHLASLDPPSGGRVYPLPGKVIKTESVDQELPGSLIDQSGYLIGKGLLTNTNTTQFAKGDKQDQLELRTNKQLRGDEIYGELFVKLIKECKKRIHDQTFLKYYITHRIEKREQLTQEQTKELNKRLEKLKLWLTNKPKSNFDLLNPPLGGRAQQEISGEVVTTGVQKAVNYSLRSSINTFKLGTSETSYKTSSTELEQLLLLQQENTILNKLNVINRLNPNQNMVIRLAQSLKQSINEQTNVASLFNQTTLFKTRTNKNLEWWRKKQRVITKRKSSRKRDRFKKQKAAVEKKMKEMSTNTILTKNSEITNSLLSFNFPIGKTNSNTLRKKQDLVSQQNNNFNESGNVWQVWNKTRLRKKLSSKGRRYRSLSLSRYLTATRKPRLIGFNDTTKIDNMSNLSGSFLTKEEKQAALNGIVVNNALVTDSIKKSQIKKRSRHSWKKRARHQFNRNHYKYRKRHIHGKGKLRVMNKKLKKLKASNELREWWWTSFLPRYLNNLESNQIPNKNQKYKPLSNTDITTNNLNKSGYLVDNYNFASAKTTNTLSTSTLSPSLDKSSMDVRMNDPLWGEQQRVMTNDRNILPFGSETTTSIPFYAGWDESLRKFVVTNRLLSRRDSGLAVNSMVLSRDASPYRERSLNEKTSIEFTNAPIQGLNEGSFLYWQTDMPFNAYSIDQFITTNQSFYAPLGWRRFEFRHSILKNWVTSNVKSNPNILTSDKEQKIYKIILVNPSITSVKSNIKTFKENNKTNKLVARRVKKRYKLLKQTPNQLMYAPTGPLLTTVLPAHYISVFDQQYRFPRNRYLKRNPLKTIKKTTLLAMIDSVEKTNTINKDFTLRKRVKPRRKYHRKRMSEGNLIFPRRTKFISNISTSEQKNVENLTRWRPSSKTKQKITDSGRIKTKVNKRVKTNPLRLRQLRRREFQQILKPTQRYIPQNGGFTWPGDYLRLEVVEMPKLKTLSTKQTNSSNKLPSIVQPVGIMPRKYLIEKHNINVLKKKLEKAYASHQFNQTLQEYKKLASISG